MAVALFGAAPTDRIFLDIVGTGYVVHSAMRSCARERQVPRIYLYSPRNFL
jgi:hypothetical protein